MKIHSTFSSLVIAIFFVIATNHHVISSSSASSPLNNKHTPPTASPSLLPSSNFVRGGGGDDENKRTSADATSSSSQSTNNDELPKKSSANNININTSNTNSSPSRTIKSTSSSSSNSNSVTFLYELYEHEIYSPSTDSWTSRRFTQSPNTGGGGRETSLNPQSCTPPRNYYFDSEWKIDMVNTGSGEYSKDGFGWEYYVGRYDGLGRRRRRWVRNLRRVSGLSSAGVAMAKSLEAKKNLQQLQKDHVQQKKASSKSSSSSLNKPKKSATYQPPPPLLKSIQDSYNFKGFGWSFYKSLVFKKSFGAAFRIPLSANFDGYDKYLAAPYISSSTYFGYPLVVATFLNASIPLEAIKWVLGGVVWKISWCLAVMSAFVRGVIESVVWVILGPWRVWQGVLTMMSVLANKLRFGGGKEEEKQQEKEVLINDDQGLLHGAANVTIETHIEMNNSSEYSNSGTDNKSEEMSAVSANAVADSPRGGAVTNTAVKDSTTQAETTKSTKEETNQKKPRLTLSGNEVPTFHYPHPIQYSYTVQERLGVCMSWRFSAERGYEFRTNFFFSCLPTRLFWEQVDMERKRRLNIVKERVARSSIWGRIRKNDPSSAKFVGTIEADKIGDKISTTDSNNKSKSSRSLSKSQQTQSSSALSTFLYEHSSTLGVSSGFPLPIHPFVSANLLFTMSSFYYGWLFRYIRSLFVLPLPSSRSSSGSVRSKELKSSSSQYYDDASISSSSSRGDEKLVSFALKKTLEEGTEQHLAMSVKSSDDDESSMGMNSTQIDFSDSDTEEDCLANVTEVNVAGI